MPLLTEHFSLQELSVTQQVGPDLKPLYNLPDDLATLYLRLLAETILEPIRVLWDCPVKVTSGFRSDAVERAVQKKSPQDALNASQHRRGQAADIHPVGSLDLDEAYHRVWASALPYDQLILEAKRNEDGTIVRWIHVSCAPIFYPPRRMAGVMPDGKTWANYAPPTTEGIA